MKPSLLSCLTLSVLATSAVAQSYTYPLNPRSTYLRTNSDSPLPPLILDLVALGIPPGTWLRLGTVGAFSYYSGGPDNYRNLVGVFSASNQLLASNVQNRVPAAIGAGPSLTSPGTYYGNLPMDIAQDFLCSRNLWGDSMLVEVPPAATHLFLGVHDSLYGDNSDPNGDFAAVVTVVPTPTLPGTGEHVELLAAAGGSPVASPDVHTAAPGSAMVAELRCPIGLVDGSLYLFFADTMPTGGPAPQLLPRAWFGNLFILQFGLLPGTAGWSDTWTMVAPGGLLGTSLIVQAGVLTGAARNGLYETTTAHRFVLQ
ncbi:MAG TPA: hypothetical protein VFZ65_01025 [Planctomycetota bacterium]|nr:hypothetical protein [Planctomycetota bacterium]